MVNVLRMLIEVRRSLYTGRVPPVTGLLSLHNNFAISFSLFPNPSGHVDLIVAQDVRNTLAS